MRWKNQDIPDQAILTYIENNARFAKKVMKLIGQMTGGQQTLTPQQRTDRARKAANARWKKE